MNKNYVWVLVVGAVLLAFGIGFAMNRPQNESTPAQQTDTTPPPSNQSSSLDASGRQLTTLPNDIASQTNLTDLNLSNNQLTTLPDSLANLTKLESLNIENNRLEHVPDVLKRMTWLTFLDISNNRIPAEEVTELKAALPDTEIKS